MFLITDKSTSEYPGPVKRFRDRLPAPVAGAKAFGLTHCSPTPATKVRENPVNGSPTRFTPGRCVPASKLNGWPLWNTSRLLNCQPCVTHLGPCEEPGMS